MKGTWRFHFPGSGRESTDSSMSMLVAFYTRPIAASKGVYMTAFHTVAEMSDSPLVISTVDGREYSLFCKYSSELSASAPRLDYLVPITGRDLSRYNQIIRGKYEFNLDEQREEMLEGRIIEVGTGLSSFVGEMALLQADSKNNRPSVIDQVPYRDLRDALSYIADNVPDALIESKGEESIPIAEAIRRIDILLNPELIDLHQIKLGNKGIQLPRRGDYVFDMWGVGLHGGQRAANQVENLVSPGGRLFQYKGAMFDPFLDPQAKGFLG